MKAVDLLKGEFADLVDEVGDNTIKLFRLIRKSFDPHGIFNPGKTF